MKQSDLLKTVVGLSRQIGDSATDLLLPPSITLNLDHCEGESSVPDYPVSYPWNPKAVLARDLDPILLFPPVSLRLHSTYSLSHFATLLPHLSIWWGL